MCEVFNQLRITGVIKGKSCPIEPTCYRKDIPMDDFNPLMHCVAAGVVKLQEPDLREPSAEDLIAQYQKNIIQK